MKLPTLNIDVALNTKTLSKGVAEAQKQINTIGKQGLSLGGGFGGKLGQISGIAGGLGGGALGASAVGIGGLVLSVMAPFKAASWALDGLREAVDDGKKAMEEFAKTGKLTGGLDLGTASRLAAASERVQGNQMATGGLWSTWVGASMNEQGQMGGLQGFVADWAQSFAEGAKWVTALSGAMLGGNEGSALDIADAAISRSAAGAQAYMTPEQINATADQAEKYRKQQREMNS